VELEDSRLNTDTVGRCWHCGRELTRADLGREQTCLGCGRATRVCLNCRWYQRGRPNDCIEPMAEPVAAKDRANFCDFFEPTLQPRASGSAGADTDALRQAAEDLFK
jgi:hypothetical protein